MDKSFTLEPTTTLSNGGNVKGLTKEHQEIYNRLHNELRSKRIRNMLKRNYYEGKNRLKDLQISIPPMLRNVETVVGWPAQAVDMLAARSIFEGITTKDEDKEHELAEIFTENQFRLLYRQACTSELINSCSFITVVPGTLPGDPAVVLNAYSAESASALWDERKKRIYAGLVTGEASPGVLIEHLMLDSATVEIRQDKKGNKFASYQVHSLGRPMMEPLRYAPSLRRPFGKSRISRAVMSITDSAVRASLRAEISAEFFTAPQKYLLGVDKETLQAPSQWEAYIGRIFTITASADGQTPTFGQLPQMSMQPHIDYIRSLAARFAGETGVPVSSLGIIHDNPASAQAIYAAKEDLLVAADILNTTNGESVKNIARLALAIKHATSFQEMAGTDLGLSVHFKNPAMPTVISQADSISKTIAAMPWMADSDVALEEFGFSDDQIARLKRDRRRAEIHSLMMSATAETTQTPQAVKPEGQSASVAAKASSERENARDLSDEHEAK